MNVAARLLAFACALGVLAGVARAEGPGFDMPPAVEALIVASRIAGVPDPEPALVERVHADLAAIRAAFPALAEIRARVLELPGRIDIVTDDLEGFRRLMRGDVPAFDALNRRFAPLQLTADAAATMIIVNFETPFPAEPLARLYRALPGVEAVWTHEIAGDGSTIASGEVGRYEFHLRWEGCAAGCKREHVWDVEVVDGEPRVVDERGDPPRGTAGA